MFLKNKKKVYICVCVDVYIVACIIMQAQEILYPDWNTRPNREGQQDTIDPIETKHISICKGAFK